MRLLLMVLAALLVAASLGNPTLKLPSNTYEFLFVVDITGSMNVADVAGDGGAGLSRLAFARQLVRKALEEMPCGSRAGLSVFTEHRTFLLFAPIEICDNHGVISTMVDSIDWRMAWAARSEVAKGLFGGIESISTLAAMETASGAGKIRLVFMTDGHEAPPVHPQLRPKFRGRAGDVGGLIAGIGGLTPIPIPHLDDDNQVIGYWTRDEVMQVDRHSLGRPSTESREAMAGIEQGDLQKRITQGTEHLSSLRENYLQQLAAETGLDYLRVTTGEAFASALMDPRYATRHPVVAHLAWIPAALGLLCLVALFAIQLRHTVRDIREPGEARWSPGRRVRAARGAGAARQPPERRR